MESRRESAPAVVLTEVERIQVADVDDIRDFSSSFDLEFGDHRPDLADSSLKGVEGSI